MGDTTKKFLVTTGIGIVLAMLVAWGQGLFGAATAVDVCRILSDGFFVAGALLLAAGGLIWTSNGGVFDGLGFTFKTLFARVRSDYEHNRMTYAEYREAREKKNTSPKHMLLAGVVHAGIALIFMFVYSMLSA